MFEALGVVPGRDEERPSDVHAYSAESNQLRRSRLNEGLELFIEEGRFSVKLVPRKGKAAEDDSGSR